MSIPIVSCVRTLWSIVLGVGGKRRGPWPLGGEGERITVGLTVGNGLVW